MERSGWAGKDSSGLMFDLPYAAMVLGGISVWTLRKHIAQGRVRVIRIGRRIFIDAVELDRIRREGLPSLRVTRNGGLPNSDGDLNDGGTE